MVDVHCGIRLPTPDHLVHQPFETDFFLFGGEGPAFFVGEAAPSSACDKTEQVLLPAAAYERITFEVDKHVFGRRRRQSAKARVFCDREQFVNSLALHASVYLDASLFAHSLVRLTRSVERFLLKWNRKYRETGNARGIPRNELIPLQARDPCDEREMVIGSSRRIALLVPATNVAMGARLGICWSRVTAIARFLKACFDMAEIGGVVSDSMSLFCEIDHGRYNVHEFGSLPLHGSQ